MITHYERDEAVAPGLRSTEEQRRAVAGRPVRDCSLRQTGVERLVSDLNLVSFTQRFGAVSVPAEGIGGVETLPEFRRQGYVRKLLERAIAGVAARVTIVLVSDAIEDLYEKVGCVTCLAEGYVEAQAQRCRPRTRLHLMRCAVVRSSLTRVTCCDCWWGIGRWPMRAPMAWRWARSTSRCSTHGSLEAGRKTCHCPTRTRWIATDTRGLGHSLQWSTATNHKSWPWS